MSNVSRHRIVEYQHFLEFVNQHKQLLQLTIKNCELAEEITDTVDEFISSGCNAIERRYAVACLNTMQSPQDCETTVGSH